MLSTLPVPVVLADEAEFAARLNEARQAALSGAGRGYYYGAFSKELAAKFNARLKQLDACRTKDETGASFDLLLKLAADGRVAEAIANPKSKIAACYRKQALKDRFPKPPSAAFWVAVSVRFGKQTAVDVKQPLPTRPTRELITSLTSGDPSVRAAAALELAGATELQAEARAALEPLRADSDKSVRYAATWAVLHIPRDPQHLQSSSAEASSFDTPPRPIQLGKPSYPQAAFMLKIEGTVLVEFLIDEQGEVAHAAIRRSIPELDAEALATVRQWTFEPARVKGAPTATLAQAPVNFRIY